MSEINTGGPAFPVVAENGMGHVSSGITLRDYFAAKAMSIMWDAYDKGYCGLNDKDAPNIVVIAEASYQLADAMLKAREQQP